MKRFFLAVRVFFLTLGNAALAEILQKHLGKGRKGEFPPPPAADAPKPAPAPKTAARSEALTLLAVLQREARLLDFVMEPLGGYSDAQVGAVARNVHRDSAAVLTRLFAPRPAVHQDEGSPVEVPAGFDAGRFRLTGNVAGEPPYHGRLVHPGWEASKCELPTWSGSKGSIHVIAPAEVEL
ncbi:MAG: DUF2760 domain-containing protein [Pirellulales bacterium]|nr:DUF2760 domain-containing protein [Pirellulales bacterium]